MLKTSEFLSVVAPYQLAAFIDDQPLTVVGCDPEFITYVKDNYKHGMIFFGEYYSDPVILFVVFAFNSVRKLQITEPMVYPNIEWRVIHTPSNTELDCHFSYQLPGDGSSFTVTAQRDEPYWGLPARNPKDEPIPKPIIFKDEANPSIARVPVLHIPKNLETSLGFLAVQESEAIIDLTEFAEPVVYTVNDRFIYDVSAKIVDRRKQNYQADGILSESINDYLLLYSAATEKFFLPLLCRNEG